MMEGNTETIDQPLNFDNVDISSPDENNEIFESARQEQVGITLPFQL